MALTKPFINNMPAFDAEKPFETAINVLGGDAINGYAIRIYNNDSNNAIVFQSPIYEVNDDSPSDSIRTFHISLEIITALKNNNTYSIEPIIYSSEQPNGQVGQRTILHCYKTPIVKLQYVDIDESLDYTNLQNGVTIKSSSEIFKIIFDKLSLNSIAEPNSARIVLYGIDNNDNKNLIYETTQIYKFKSISSVEYEAVAEVGGFSINSDSDGDIIDTAKFKSFEIYCEVITIENMKISISYNSLNCYYKTIANSPYFTINNLCDQGIIRINCNLTSFAGESNIPVNLLQYFNNEELDLRSETYSPNFHEAYVKWTKYFLLSQPYTLRIWARGLEVGEILRLSNSNNNGAVLSLYYNIDEDGAFISLKTRYANSNGTLTYPYYIESERISLSGIDEDTKLFIGIQEQQGLFDIIFAKNDT